MDTQLAEAIGGLGHILVKLPAQRPALLKLGQAMMDCWDQRGKVLLAGNGGSAADAIHLAEELMVRYQKPRKALAAIALLDGAALTCAGNDFGFDNIFSRQVEALGNRGDILVVFSTSGNSPNILRAIEQAKSQGLVTAAFLGRDGGKARGLCDIELIIQSDATARIQEAHQVLYHVLCEWIDSRVS